MNLVRFQKPVYSYRFNNLMTDFLTDYSAALNYKPLNSVPVNIAVDNNNYKIQFLAPGFKKEDFTIKHQNGILKVTGMVNSETNSQNEFLKKEFDIKNFERSFNIPDTVDTEKIIAKYSEGILEVELPKKEEVVQKTEKEIAIQ